MCGISTLQHNCTAQGPGMADNRLIKQHQGRARAPTQAYDKGVLGRQTEQMQKDLPTCRPSEQHRSVCVALSNLQERRTAPCRRTWRQEAWSEPGTWQVKGDFASTGGLFPPNAHANVQL